MSKRLTQDEFIKRAKLLHGDKYTYSLVVLQGLHGKVTIGCPQHGEFTQQANSHIRGTGCPRCGQETATSKQTMTRDEFILKANEVHGNIYDYSNTEFTSTTDKVTITCPQHGEFSQLASSHLAGHGCAPCAYSRISSDKALDTTAFIALATVVHDGRYDYSKAHYTRSTKKLEIICPTHGSYWARAANHLSGIGCNKCAIEIKRAVMLKDYEFNYEGSKLHPTDTPSFVGNRREFLCDCGRTSVTSSRNVSTGKVKTCGNCSNVPKEVWMGMQWGYLRLDETETLPAEWSPYSHERFWFICCNKKCGRRTKVLMADVTQGHTMSCGCIRIGMSPYSPAGKIHTWVSSFDDKAVFSHWFEADNRWWEYDIYSEKHKLAIEHHGLKWHTKDRVGQNDYEKLLVARKQGVQLIQVYGDEWADENKQRVFKEMFQEIIAPEPKIRIKPHFEVRIGKTPKEALIFLDNHHYLGGGRAGGGSVSVVARNKGDVVGVWVFKKKQKEEGSILWHRACWDRKYKAWNPHEKALKLALPVLKERGFTRMVTFSDNRLHTGGLYEKIGFTFEEELSPSYCYTDTRTKRVNKGKLRVKAGVNEEEAARAKGWYQIMDSGKRRYSLSLV